MNIEINRAKSVLSKLGVTWDGSGDMMALTFLVFCGMTPGMQFRQMTTPALTITQAMQAMNKDWGIQYAPNTRETVRFFCVRRLMEADVLMPNPDQARPKQSPKYCYQLTPNVRDLMGLLPE